MKQRAVRLLASGPRADWGATCGRVQSIRGEAGFASRGRTRPRRRPLHSGTTNPHGKSKPSIFWSHFHLADTPFLWGSGKVNPRSENRQFGLSVRVGGTTHPGTTRTCPEKSEHRYPPYLLGMGLETADSVPFPDPKRKCSGHGCSASQSHCVVNALYYSDRDIQRL
jgi:hypothetical protein